MSIKIDNTTSNIDIDIDINANINANMYDDVVKNKNKNKNKKKKDEIKVEMPQYSEYNHITKKRFTILELKSMLKHYKQKVSGDKKELTTRLAEYLKKSYFIIKIQKCFRGFLTRYYMASHGPAVKNRGLCVNATDFLSMDDLKDIPYEQFLSFKDDDGFIYGFDIMSLTNLVYKSIGVVKNPYNKKNIPINVIYQLKRKLRLSNILQINVLTKLENVHNELSEEKSLELRVVTLFQKIDSLGNYTQPKWFLDLQRNQLLHFMYALEDIWSHRANLSPEVKATICPHGYPFLRGNHYRNTTNIVELKTIILKSLNQLVTTGIDRDSQSLGATYVLCALTLVSIDAANALPWLYESVC